MRLERERLYDLHGRLGRLSTIPLKLSHLFKLISQFRVGNLNQTDRSDPTQKY